MGEQPSNQALLDYLAVRFMEQGWSTKKTDPRDRAQPRLSSEHGVSNARNAKVDPDNVYLWRMNRHRLEVEAIRDSLLMIAGQLDLKPPEPRRFPPQRARRRRR